MTNDSALGMEKINHTPFLFFPGSEKQPWQFGQLAIPGNISEELVFVYYWAFITMFKSRLPSDPQRSMGCSTGWARARKGGCHSPGRAACPRLAFLLAEAATWGRGGWLKARPSVLFLHRGFPERASESKSYYFQHLI